MAGVLGLILGLGLAALWWSCWPRTVARPKNRPESLLSRRLRQAGIARVSPASLVFTSLALALCAFLLSLAVTSSVPIAGCFALFSGWLPWSLVQWRARRRIGNRRRAWPDAVDHLRSGIRAGMSLPEALMQLSTKGPEELRPEFVEFAHDYRATGRMDPSLTALKARLADPVADRIIEALRLTRDVGGTDLGRLLATLAEFLRDDARTRGELEARQSWTINGARLAVAAPWIVLLLMSTRPEAVRAYSTGAGAVVLVAGLLVSILCYRLMLRIGALPVEARVLE